MAQSFSSGDAAVGIGDFCALAAIDATTTAALAPSAATTAPSSTRKVS